MRFLPSKTLSLADFTNDCGPGGFDRGYLGRPPTPVWETGAPQNTGATLQTLEVSLMSGTSSYGTARRQDRTVFTKSVSALKR